MGDTLPKGKEEEPAKLALRLKRDIWRYSFQTLPYPYFA
jgi:hypothetical protein